MSSAAFIALMLLLKMLQIPERQVDTLHFRKYNAANFHLLRQHLLMFYLVLKFTNSTITEQWNLTVSPGQLHVCAIKHCYILASRFL